ncbi:hypothetical protein QQS21_003435 [Conoideocrella luteorostrata]|uniref:Negative acting factor n=1 Tax=Conoideocrella luteorostrata TaxID=1105319 RepID=A0AAJ0FVK5_9HYPO|nr:hypothetical protein QQS21_003435 [Conoideocrella luteorostrata]
MASDDLGAAQDVAVGVGLLNPSNNTTGSPNNAPVSGPSPGPGLGPDPDTATPGNATAAAAVSSFSAVHSSAAITRASSPLATSISAVDSIPTTTIAIATTSTGSALTSTSTSTAATTAATAATKTDEPAPESSTGQATSPQAAVQTSTSVSESPATVAAPAPAPAPTSQPQQNGDSKASETDSEMASYRPAFTAHHGLSVSYAAAAPTIPSSTHLASSVPSDASAYASPAGMTSTQYASYPASTGVSHANEGYRVSPVSSNGPMSLPSMRTIDAMSQRVSPTHAQHHPMSMSMNASLTPVSSSPSYYTPQHALSVPSNYSLPSDSLARYPLPHDPRILGSRGPKKCDETHPTCNNCKKSKRDCLGYDPIFRQQPGAQLNSQIQPAPTSQPTVPSSIPSSATTHSTAGVGQVSTNSYGSQPSMLPSSYSTTPPPSTLPPSSTAYATSVSSSYNSPVVANTTSIKSESSFDFSAPADPLNRYLPAAPSQEPAKLFGGKTSPTAASNLPGPKTMKINEIIDLLGPPPPTQQISHTEETFHEITKVYHEMYAGGLSAFLETTWYYFVENGKMTFPKDANLMEHMATFLKILEAVKANDHSQMAYSGVLETRIVWELACTAYQTPDQTNQTMRMAMPPDGDAVEARNRLRVIETLLCGEYLPTNPLAPPLSDPDVHRSRQFDFWFSLAEFVRRQDDPDSPQAIKTRDDALARMRHLLDGRENRDVLYSIAVVRELAPTYGPSYGSTPQHVDESDPKNRLAVASKFILDEAQVTGGTTNVVRRFSDIASRAFVNPAVNVIKRTS